MLADPKISFRNPPGFQLDFSLLREFDRGLNVRVPERSLVPCRILGHGEISTALEIQIEPLRGLAFKRMAIFETPAEVLQYLDAYQEYNSLLENDIGLHLPPHGHAVFLSDAGRPIFYIIQKQVAWSSIGNRALELLSRDGARALVKRVLRELRKVWAFNLLGTDCQVAVDAQVSNWALEMFDPDHPDVDEETPLYYLDTSTPLFRVAGVEQLNAELFLRAAPSYLVWVLRLFFLDEVLNRYYEPRKVVVDLIANLHRDQQTELIRAAIDVANIFLAGEAADLNLDPVGAREIRAYYREDAVIWSLYAAMRRFDRFLHRRLLRRDYPYILPGKDRR